MYRVLVVDDEPIAAKSIEHMLNKNFTNIEIVGIAKSGRDAIEKSYTVRPDIIIMDINMPGINGLEAIEKIRETNHEICFVIITAFDSFDYAMKAIDMEVSSYLLKPVKVQKLVETINGIISNLEVKRKNIITDLRLKERIEMIEPVLESGCINSICTSGDTSYELMKYCDLFEMPTKSGFVMVVELGEMNDKGVNNRIGAGVHIESKYSTYREIIKNSCKCIVGRGMVNRIIAFIFATNNDNYEQKTEAVDIAKVVHKNITKMYPFIKIGVGSYVSNITDAKKSLQQGVVALNMAYNLGNDDIMHFDDIVNMPTYAGISYEAQFQTHVYDNVSNFNMTGAIDGFKKIFDSMQLCDELQFSDIKNLCIEFMVGFGLRWGRAVDNYCIAINGLISATSNEELYEISRHYIGKASEQISSDKQNKVNEIILKANEYMQNNYNKELSLEDIAKEVHLSSYYFSRFYKEETGNNFSDVLLNIRINKAKELFENDEMSSKDVAMLVGFSDPNYFSKTFKKVTGMTVSEYKKML